MVQLAVPYTAAMNRDLAHYATSKLQGDWSALAFTKSLTREMLQSLIPRFEKLDPLVRFRLLLAALMLPPAQREELLPELQARACTGRSWSAVLEAPVATLWTDATSVSKLCAASQPYATAAGQGKQEPQLPWRCVPVLPCAEADRVLGGARRSRQRHAQTKRSGWALWAGRSATSAECWTCQLCWRLPLR